MLPQHAGFAMSDGQDRLFAKSRATTTGFQFDEKVVRVFPDMISRSVPGYELVVPMIGMLARRYAQPDSYRLKVLKFWLWITLKPWLRNASNI